MDNEYEDNNADHQYEDDKHKDGIADPAMSAFISISIFYDDVDDDDDDDVDDEVVGDDDDDDDDVHCNDQLGPADGGKH